MITFFVVFLVYVSIVGHEFGHLITMQNNGVTVSEFGIGFPWGKRISYIPKKGRFADIRFSLYLFTWILGGFVRNDENETNSLSYGDKAFVYCAGPFANIHFGCLLTIFSAIASLVFSPYISSANWMQYVWYVIYLNPSVWGSIITIPILWFGRKWISIYCCQLVGILFLVWLVKEFSGIGIENLSSHFVGPVGTVALISHWGLDIETALFFAGRFSILIGLFNLMPIPPMDGGLLVLPLIEKKSQRFASVYSKFGLVFLSVLTVLVFAQDISTYLGKEALAVFFISLGLIYLFRKHE